jgi:hypothetical protein
MAKRFLTPLNLSNLASDPATGSEGDLYFNTTNDVVKIYVNGEWTELQGGGGGSVIYSPEQPDINTLDVGTIWMDSNAEVSGGGGGGGGGGPSFRTISTSPSSQVITALTTTEDLKFVSGENISIVANDSDNTVTINSTGNYSNVNSISTPEFIQFDTTANVNPVTGLLGWDSVEGTLNLGLSSGKHIHLGEESVFRVRNSTGSTIGKGTALYASGVEPSGRIQVTPYVADGSVREVRFMGLATESISSGVNGFVQHFGYVRDLDTRGTSSTSISVGDETWAAGDLLYVHPTVPGKLTNVKPQHEIVVAIIIIRHQSTGILFVRPTSGGHLEDIHDISLSSLSNEDILIYNSASSIWVNSPKQNIINTASAAAVSYLVDGAPEALNTLNELSEALNDNADILDTLLTTTAASSTYLPLSSSASFYRWTKTYSASASVISGVDDNSISLSYNEGYIQLFINGVMLDPSEYTATDGSTITVNAPVLSGEVVDIFAFLNSTSVNTYSQAQINDAFLTKSSASTTYLTQSSASTTYLTQSNGITAATASATYISQSSPVTSFKNKIINSEFDIWQRGTSFNTNGVYTADRWQLSFTGTSAAVTTSRVSFTPGNEISNYESEFFIRNAVTGGTGTSALSVLTQKIEDVRTLAGQTITVSFWAKAASGTPSIGLDLYQEFGSGGSATVGGQGASKFQLSTSWQRFTKTLTLASISGKTIGAGSLLATRFWFSSGSDYNSLNDSLGIQSNTFDIWGVQVEKGSIATEFEQRFIGDELLMCQRYYQVVFNWYTFWNTANNVAAGGVIFNIPFRSSPLAVSGTQSSLYRYGPGGQRSSTLVSFQDYSTTTAYAIVTDNGGTPFVTNQPSVHNIGAHFSAEL